MNTLPFHLFPAGLLLLLATLPAAAAPKAPLPAWTDPAAALREDPDFGVQGEYAGSAAGAQVVALGDGRFDAYLLEGGLPGAGWEPGKARTRLQGGRGDGGVVLKDEAGTTTATLRDDRLLVVGADGVTTELTRTTRRSPTLEEKPPEGAVVLFDGGSAEAWENGKVENGLLLATGCTSREQFADYTLHLEFRTPYMPTARGQQRGNSGIYHSGRWETQILDSFGLEGKDNECGGIYSVSKPRLNMCLPPLAWQTYDVDFTAAKFNPAGQRLTWPRITVRLNGVLVHEDLELAKDFTTAAPRTYVLSSPNGPIFLQNHGNPVVFRNIWVLPGR